ncbi:MAG: helix-turn-helix domain-containing protein [Deltaproteobacteria bacterium]|nr:helix-turn-helix domain-containing protein [Deltaproteobacteria bacterium]
MSNRNPLLTTQPFEVEQALKRLGANLRVARLRRRLTLQEAAAKIGTGVRAVADAEKGKPSTGIAVYAALLWAYGLLNGFELLADPQTDSEGAALALAREPTRARVGRGGLSNDF